MCVIFTLLPGQMIPEQKLENAVANNLHGYGIIMHPNGELHNLEVIKGFEKDGINHEAIYEILRYNKDYVRHVHLRNMTHGTVSEDNVHPFKVYEDENRTVYLMHNGSFYDFKPQQGDDRSDTRLFCDNFMTPLLSKFEGQWGRADYNDPLFRDIAKKFIGINNRVLLVSNDLIPGYFGDWDNINAEEKDEKFRASNNHYFNAITRGPRKQANTPFQNGHASNMAGNSGIDKQVIPSPAKQETKETFEEREKRIKTTGENVINLNTLIRERPRFEPNLQLLKLLGPYAGDIWESHQFSMMSWVKDQEIVDFIKALDDSDMALMMRDLISTIEQMEEENGQVELELIRTEEENKEILQANIDMSNRIQRMEKELKELKAKIPFEVETEHKQEAA